MMEEIRMWSMVTSTAGQAAIAEVSPASETATEKLLEDALTFHPELLMPGLTLVGRQNSTPGGPLDLLGIDDDGRLVVFELKRGKLTREAVAQALDYASYLADLEPSKLAEHISANAGHGGTEQIEDFASWYQNQYRKSVTEIGVPRVVLVGLGADERTKRMVEFLSKSELDISLITFHGFHYKDETFLARQVEVQARPALSGTKATKQANQIKLDGLLDTLKLRKPYEAAAEALKSGMDDSVYRWTNANGYSFYLQELSENGNPTLRSYAALYVSDKRPGQIQLNLQPRAVEALSHEAVHVLAKHLNAQAQIRPGGTADIWFAAKGTATSDYSTLTSLGSEMSSAWRKKMEAITASSTNEAT